MSAETLLEEVSPFGNLQAVVESDGRACYFYLFGAREADFGMRSVWVRNLGEAPPELDVAAMRDGEAPLNPKASCVHPTGAPPLRADDLRVVWLPEGNGAALYEQDDLLAVIPPWSGENGFHGYARDSIGQGPVAWALTPDNACFERFANAARYWATWDQADPWPAISDRLVCALERAFGERSNYYAIDGGNWPPRALLRIPRGNHVVLATVGMSLVPMPNVERSLDDPAPHRRIELGVVIPASWPDDSIKRLCSYVAAQSALPWSRYTWLGHGHTIPCDSWRASSFDSALLVDRHPAVHHPDLGRVFEDPVSMLWFLPITQKELDRCVDEGSVSVLSKLPVDRWRQA